MSITALGTTEPPTEAVKWEYSPGLEGILDENEVTRTSSRLLNCTQCCGSDSTELLHMPSWRA